MPKSLIPKSDVHATASTSTPVASRTESHPISVATTSRNQPVNEKTQTELLSCLYDLNMPAIDIALVVNAMRGKCTREEEVQLLQRLYSFQVPSAVIAQMVDAMRGCDREGPSSRGVVREDTTGDAPPGYDSKL
jgi:hypothetical protein